MTIDSPDAFAERRAAAAGAFAEHKLDSLIVTHPPNIRYLTGFTGSNGVLLLLDGSAELFTDPRYTTQAAEQVSCKVRIGKAPLLERLVVRIGKLRLRRTGFERAHVNYDQHEYLAERLPAAVKLRPVARFIETLRMVKSPGEMELIRRSVETNSAALEAAIGNFQPGMRENEFAAEIDYQSRKRGAEAPAFETIVAAGSHAALPHARPTSAPIANGSILLIDMGALQNGYCSDMTRMLHLGTAPPKVRDAYEATLAAQLAALDAVKAGANASDVDRAARRVLKSAGLAIHFIHSTGHGLGLEIHEGPRIGQGDESVLQAGMAITIEPGVYFPGEFGIRIEDTVLVTETGCEVLTQTPKELRVF